MNLMKKALVKVCVFSLKAMFSTEIYAISSLRLVQLTQQRSIKLKDFAMD